MQCITGTLDFKIEEPAVVTLGKFDGLHEGHKCLMRKMREAKEEGLISVALTFDFPITMKDGVIRQVLTTRQEKRHIMEEAGVDVLVEIPFTRELKTMAPYDFLKMITSGINIRRIVVGTDFHFGHNRAGDYHTLRQYEEELGYRLTVVEKLQYQAQDISSTRIRGLICEGSMEEANCLLGYSYFLVAPVITGKRLGRTLGFPTANQRPEEEKLLPPNGVYAVEAEARGKAYQGVADIGQKPTVDGENPLGVETYLFDFDGDLYGEIMKVSFLHYIRPERRFEDLEALKAQIRADEAAVREWFAAV